MSVSSPDVRSHQPHHIGIDGTGLCQRHLSGECHQRISHPTIVLVEDVREGSTFPGTYGEHNVDSKIEGAPWHEHTPVCSQLVISNAS